MLIHTQCVVLHTLHSVCNFPHSVQFYTECVILHTGCNFTHIELFVTQCVSSHTVCNFTHFVQMFVNMCHGNIREAICVANVRCFVARYFLSYIYALLSVKFSDLKMCRCKKKDQYEV